MTRKTSSTDEPLDLIGYVAAALLIDMAPRQLLRMARARQIPHYRFDDDIMFSRTDLRRWVASHRVEVEGQR